MKKISFTGRILTMLLLVSFLMGTAAMAAGQGSENVININKASVKELSKLPGIGKKKAQAIAAYRDESGPFSSIDELAKVEGIGKKTLEKIKVYLTTEGS